MTFPKYARQLLAGVIVTLCALGAVSQTPSAALKEADNFFEYGQFRAALQYYKQGGTHATWNKSTKLRVAICHYEINDINSAIPLLNQLVELGKTEALVFFYLGRAYHHNLQFERAIVEYKNFLKRAKANDPLRDWVKDEILRCAAGKSVKYAEQIAFVENLGTSVNTLYDEYAPVPSPIYQDRLYFTSSRTGSTGGLFDESGQDDLKYGKYRTDIYFSEHQNGVWRSAEQMGDALNTSRYEMLFGFSGDGQRMFFGSGNTESSLDLIIDTFDIYRDGPMRASTLGPFNPSFGDRDLYVFNDSVILFSSNRAGGSGGYDLYHSIFRDGKWSAATNLGSTVNSYYDDVAPFLTKNGRHLYFSSNRRESIGGLDVFETIFDDNTASWDSPSNLGVPINSAADDSYYRVSADGMTAFLSSNRKDGYGERDLYAAYLKGITKDHLMLSSPISYAHVTADPVEAIIASSQPASNEAIKEYYIGDLQIEANDVILSPQNIKKLDVLANLMLIYPSIKCDLICHDLGGDSRSFDLYFSIKKAEQAAEYLERKGVNPTRLYVKGCGAFYPLAISSPGAQANQAALRLNRRIEINVFETEGLPISLIYSHQNVPEEMANERALEFSDLQHGLLYRSQIASVTQLLQNDIFDKVQDAMIFLDPDSRRYNYYIGMTSEYQDAMATREFLRKNGFGDASITAHFNGRQLSRQEIVEMAEEYPDLPKLLDSTN